MKYGKVTESHCLARRALHSKFPRGGAHTKHVARQETKESVSQGLYHTLPGKEWAVQHRQVRASLGSLNDFSGLWVIGVASSCPVPGPAMI